MQKQVEKKKYYVVRERAVPEVLLKVVEAKRLLESNRVATVQEAAEKTRIRRSSFYKYKDDIFPLIHTKMFPGSTFLESYAIPVISISSCSSSHLLPNNSLANI